MEAEYDFSKGIRGKFYKKNAQFHLPIYLEPEVERFFMKLAKKQKTDLTQIVNSLLYKETKKETYQTSLEEYGDSRTQEPTLEGNSRMKL